ncbi:MAG: alanine:cation symporter family protein [Fuerstiella sp.]|nr:alanine:cation symporter family protein [Fuerstiella sp.]
MNRNVCKSGTVFSLIAAALLVAFPPECVSQNSPAPVDSASESRNPPESKSPARVTNQLRKFEQQVDKYSGDAVGIIASVFFYEFVGRCEFYMELDQCPFGSPEFSSLISSVDTSLSDEKRDEVNWSVSFVRSRLSEQDRVVFDNEIAAVRNAARPLMEKASADVNLVEADFSITLAESDVSQEESAVIADALHTEFCRSRLKNMMVTRKEIAPGETRTFQAVNSGIPVVVAWLVIGAVFFTLRMGFINFRGFTHAIRVTAGQYDKPDDVGEVTHFQALTAALSATVGLGNIASVAIAVGVGGPGATFWMIIAGLLGMSSKFAECTLGQMYRQVRPDGQVMGGAMYYLSNGLRDLGLGPLGMLLGGLFAVMCVLASLGGGNAFQVNQAINAVQQAFPGLESAGTLGRFVIGIVMATFVAVVIIGGIRRIASTAEKIVPLMCGVYVLACAYILLMNFRAIPQACSLIVSSAFTPQAGYGAVLGVLVLGFKRAAFSNEAGIGSAAIAHSAAKTEYPVREGIVALLEPFIDTVVICTMTALVIVITGAYDVDDPRYGELILSNNGAGLTVRAMESQIEWFPAVLSVAVMLFAYSTMISWSYYGERCWTYLFGDRHSIIYRVIFVIFVLLGSVVSATNVLDLSDLMVLGMAFPNVLGVALLSGKVRRALDDYWHKFKRGEFDKP